MKLLLVAIVALMLLCMIMMILTGCADDWNIFGDEKIEKTLTVTPTTNKTDARTFYEVVEPVDLDVDGDGYIDTILRVEQIEALKEQGWTVKVI